MNNTRRNTIQETKDSLLDLQTAIEEIREEEQQAYDNLPESLQNGERGEKMLEAIENLESAYSCLEEADSYLEAAMQ